MSKPIEITASKSTLDKVTRKMATYAKGESELATRIAKAGDSATKIAKEVLAIILADSAFPATKKQGGKDCDLQAVGAAARKMVCTIADVKAIGQVGRAFAAAWSQAQPKGWSRKGAAPTKVTPYESKVLKLEEGKADDLISDILKAAGKNRDAVYKALASHLDADKLEATVKA